MPPRQIREESWNSLHRSEASGENVDEGYSDVSMDEQADKWSDHSSPKSPLFPTVNAVHRALHPLQVTADRVGKQVEKFAENLDRMSVKKHKRSSEKGCNRVLPLINVYQDIAKNTVRHLETMHAPERSQQLSKKTRRKLRSSSGRSTPASQNAGNDREDGAMTSVEDLKYWKQEEQTWELLRLMIQVEYPAPDSPESQIKENRASSRPRKIQLHRYSSEKDVWESFLAADDQAWERHTVVKWLQETAENSGQSIEQAVEELESDADRGSGLWAHSWLYSKEAIKGQKRLRSWPKALEPDSPGLDFSLMNSEKTQPLVTQLDPDAITRQARTLEKQDQYFERAIWLACWEMLRRGKHWDYMREWCGERVENWRATAMHGDPRNTILHSSSSASWQSRALWRKTCALAAKECGIDEYENAVYGALSGYLPSVLKVSHSWDDHVYAHYNSYLLYSFDRFMRFNCADRLPNALADQHSSFNLSIFGGQRVHSGNQLIEKLKRLDSTNEEARTPLKMLQGSIIARTFDEFVVRQGARLSRSANAEMKSKILSPMNESILEGCITADINMADHELLRMITHMIFLYQDLGFDFGDGDRRYAMENIVVAYVDFLSKAGKQQLLPLYASRLSSERSVTCLGRHLPTILDRAERQTFLRLMTKEGINAPAVLSTQLIMIIADSPAPETNSISFPKLAIVEKTNKDTSTIRQPQEDFIGNSITADQQDLIRGFEWYLLLDGLWKETMMVGTVIYKHLLRTNALAAARLMSQAVTFSDISLSKSRAILNQTVDISKSQDLDDDGGDLENTKKAINKSQQSKVETRNVMLSQAKAFRDFENFFTAIDAMEEWAGLAHKMNSLDPRRVDRNLRKEFQESFGRVEKSIQPLLHNWLQDPKSDTEASEFKQIRVACLPEVVLAYVAILDTSSHFLSRDLLLRGMDLAAVVAAENSDLGACFMEAGRMPELVDSFAYLSKSMIWADDLGTKGGRSKKKKNGETLSLWSVRTPSPSS